MKIKTKTENMKIDWRYLTTVPVLAWVIADKFKALHEKNDANRRKSSKNVRKCG